MSLPTRRPVTPLAQPPDVTVRVPGSKSLTNRALVAAALADGDSTLHGALFSDDTDAMVAGLRSLGVGVRADPTSERIEVEGTGGVLAVSQAEIDVRLSGTTARFLAPVLALGHGRFRLDGAPPFRQRPMGPTIAALRHLGVEVVEEGRSGHLPITVVGDGLEGGTVPVTGNVSSQYLSGLLLAGPRARGGLELRLTTPLVSEPYVALTTSTMAAFGVEVERPDPFRFVVPGSGYRGGDYEVEPDASAASYLLAAAAITGGRVRVAGLTADTQQGDADFARVLERMGAEVTVDAHGTEVRGTGHLEGIDIDLSRMSDVAQTLATTAVFADGPTRITGIGFIRGKETDRIQAVVTELQRCGIHAQAEDDGLVIHPGRPTAAAVRTYDDHRMAMSFALLGLVADGIEIVDPGCVAKTFPTYFEVLDELRAAPAAAGDGGS